MSPPCLCRRFVSLCPRAPAERARRSTKQSASVRRAWAAPSSPSPTMPPRPGGTRRASPAAAISTPFSSMTASRTRPGDARSRGVRLRLSRPRPQLLPPVAQRHAASSSLYRPRQRRTEKMRACLSQCSAPRSGSRSDNHLVVGSTRRSWSARWTRPSGDLDIGAMAMFGRAAGRADGPERQGTRIREGDRDVQAAAAGAGRGGVTAGSRGRASGTVTVAVDADLTTTPTVRGRRAARRGRGRDLDVEADWSACGAASASSTIGETPALGQRWGERGAPSGIYRRCAADRGGSDEARNGWGFGLRVTF